MKNNNRNRRKKQSAITSSKALAIGDFGIIKGMQNTPCWKTLLTNSGKALDQLFYYYFRFNAVLLAYGVAAVFRYRFSSLTTGFIPTLLGISLMAVCNSIHIWKIFTPVMLFATPALPFFIDSEILYRWIFIDIHSTGLLVYTLLFALASLTHTLMAYTGHGNPHLTKRGDSWLFVVLSKLCSLIADKTGNEAIKKCVKESFVMAVVEPVLVIGTALYIGMVHHDYHFAVLLGLMGINEFWLQLQDKSARLDKQLMLNT